MQIKYLEQWLHSPVSGRRRIAIKRLTKLAAQGFYDPKKIFNHAKKAFDDEDWRVRASVATAVADLALKHEEFAHETLVLLMEKLETEEHYNVTANILRGIARLFNSYDLKDRERAYSIALSMLETPNSDVKHGSIALLTSLAIWMEDKVTEIVKKITDVFNSLPPLVRGHTFSLLRKIYEKYPDKIHNLLTPLALEHMTNENHIVTSEALSTVALLIRNGHLELNELLLREIDKKLKIGKDAERISSVSVLDAIFEKNPTLADLYLKTLGNLLLTTKNNHLKLKILECLMRHIDDIPRDTINRHQLARILDILEFNTTPKNPSLRRIKTMARSLLEDKLGYGFEDRRRLRGY